MFSDGKRWQQLTRHMKVYMISWYVTNLFTYALITLCKRKKIPDSLDNMDQYRKARYKGKTVQDSSTSNVTVI